ncbi:MAG: hypothetical protein HS104_28810 [Polyangiaceae bacterium]|nr:hypothetical protein [Polyangiaceae bacterium]MCE7893552.1 hypothetical protein [Sorangiineae bacterium PRO1]MCL4756469.1 hypothetical protein [Myxococcales bacterium]
MEQRHRSQPPPLPPPVVTEVDEPEERISFVPEDDIEGGRLHVMYERLRHDDYAGAQLVAQSILEREPENHDAQQCLEMCNVELRKLYLSRVGDLGRIPQLSVEAEDLPQRVRDERSTHLLQLVNGLTPLATIVEASGLPQVEALGILSELFLRHVIEFEDE